MGFSLLLSQTTIFNNHQVINPQVNCHDHGQCCKFQHCMLFICFIFNVDQMHAAQLPNQDLVHSSRLIKSLYIL